MKYLLVLINILITSSLFSQQRTIKVEKLYSDKNSSTFLITIKDSVSLHYHSSHTENIFVIEGAAIMQLEEKKVTIQKGDYLTIPPNSTHAVWVTSENPLRVISIQSPEFNGDDRIFITNE